MMREREQQHQMPSRLPSARVDAPRKCQSRHVYEIPRPLDPSLCLDHECIFDDQHRRWTTLNFSCPPLWYSSSARNRDA